jgi:hypothetical protein
MGLRGKFLQIIAVLPGVIIIFAIVAVAAAATTATIPKPDCPSKCGDVEVPFPFGFTKGCYLDESFNITCDSGKPKTGNVTVTNISIDTYELYVLTDVAQDCYQKLASDGGNDTPYRNKIEFRVSPSTPFPTAKISSLPSAVTLSHTSVGTKMENGTISGAHLNALALAMW